jgi:hypothetical protein
LGHPNFQLIVHDVIEPIMLEVDQIYHLACPASPPHYQYNPIKTIKTSTEGALIFSLTHSLNQSINQSITHLLTYLFTRHSKYAWISQKSKS